MKKEFIFKIPDEIWVDNFSQNLSSKAVYEGPEKIYVLVSGDSIISWDINDYEFYNKSNSTVVPLDANLHPDIAYLISIKPTEKLFEDEINPDGSIYQKIKNPDMNDYYSIKYNENDETGNPWVLELKVKNRTIPEEIRVKSELEVAENHKQNSTFDADTTKVLDKYISDAKNYLQLIKNYYPWKYVDFNPPKGPKIPTLLQDAFKNIVIENITE